MGVRFRVSVVERSKALWVLKRGEASHKSGLVLVSVFLFPKVRINGPFLYPEGGGQAADLQTPNGFHLVFRK